MDLKLTNPQITGTVYYSDGVTLVSYGNIDVIPLNGQNGYYGNIYNGNFNIGALTDGDYDIVAMEDGFTDTNSFPRRITIKNGIVTPETDANLVLSLTKPQITGKVYNPDGQTLVDMGWIDVSPCTGVKDKNRIMFYNGNIKIGGLKDGDYDIVSTEDPLRTYTNSVPKRITIQNGKVTPETDANLVLSLTNPQITGTVYKPDGQTLADIGWIDFCPCIGGKGKTSINYLNGNFKIGGLTDGDYDIIVNTNNNSFTHSIPKKISIINGKLAPGSDSNMQFTLTNPLVTVSIFEPDGITLANGICKLEIKDSSKSYTIDSNEVYNGKISLGGFSDGTYTITAVTDNGCSYAKSKSKIITIIDGVPSVAADFNITMCLYVKVDVNKDNTINLLDLALEAKEYGKKYDNTTYDHDYDMNNDGIIDIYDLVIISRCVK